MPVASYAGGPFVGSAIPSGVFVLLCDGNPRISVQFSDGTKGIWYPANGGYSKEFLSVALAAKTSSSKLYFYGSDSTSTAYCVGAGNARSVYMFGLVN